MISGDSWTDIGLRKGVIGNSPHLLSESSGQPTEVGCELFIRSFGSISERTMVSKDVIKMMDKVTREEHMFMSYDPFLSIHLMNNASLHLFATPSAKHQ